ncbi:proteasome subunit alpha [Dehalococcoides sp. THU3]|jgi:hypothetical protein|uniref:hypothetical protein n=1 Tax=Dehalococcoides TaxID=61434 RepID=UPI0002B7690D|nr:MULTISPECIES: hypothetical protein [Dehalococcoides]AGG08462.1 hypothetical protein btf_1397 [Dehalococcoides mccartyi BTF08]AQX75151.1 proteasome subunit alpha [Dehalococcoides mccartyi]KSV17864.1 proteasome subunit alpha [Dehalococcoides mccartyi]OBW62398.1 MAG: proteasome subunit alpha [Dehalococcoides mccartyi]QYY57584.1 proteasome subunit alpha [Dehalococcoides mccartyi]
MENENLKQEENSLTGIQQKYTMPANSSEGEVDKLMTREFIKNLAEVSIAVASRDVRKGRADE